MDKMPGSKISVALENDSFAVPFIHLELGSGWKEGGREVGASRLGDLRGGPAGQLTRLHAPLRVARLPGACKRSLLAFQRCVTSVQKKDGQAGLSFP